MRRVILFNMVTVDGFFAGPNGEIDWHRVDEEFNEFAAEQLDTAGGLIFGRVTFQLMASYWPTDGVIKDDPIIAAKMNGIPKIVFSRTLQKVEWNNTKLVKENAAGEISRLAQQPGKDLFIFGSADLASTLTPLGLIDEYRIIVNPVVLGTGKPLFKGVQQKFDLKLVKNKLFKNGNILLYYQPAKN